MRLRCALATLSAALSWSVSAQSLSPEQIYAKVSPSVFVVEALVGDRVVGQGSSIVVDTGRLVTNCHVLEKALAIRLRQGDRSHTATLRMADHERDICHLSAPTVRAPPVVIGTSTGLKVGQRVYAIGAPLGLELTLSDGLVSALRPMGPYRLIQTSAAISPGSSGGGLFDDRARLIAITTFQTKQGQNLNFALPSEWINEVAARVEDLATLRERRDRFRKSFWDIKKREGLAAARRFAEKWTADRPSDAFAWRDLGQALVEERRFEPAVRALRQGLSSPMNSMDDYFEYWGSWLQLGVSLEALGQDAEAIEAYRQTLLLVPIPELFGNIEGLFQKSRRFDRAIEVYAEVTQAFPGSYAAWERLGGAYLNARQWSNSRTAFERSLALNQENARAWLGLYISSRQLGDSEAALQAFRQVQRYDPAMAADVLRR